jgi:hypothetical protein
MHVMQGFLQNRRHKSHGSCLQETICESNTVKAQKCERKCTSTRLVVLPPYTKPGNIGEPADLFDIVDTGSDRLYSMEGGIRVGCAGCSARSAALELQSIVPQACSSVVRAGFARSGQYV